MKHGNTAFVGARLRVARELRRIGSATALAEELLVSKSLISQYETGSAKPPLAQLERIASKLGMPIGFFFKPMPDAQGQAPFFRSMASAVDVERGRARSLLTLLSDVTEYILEYVELPDPSLPQHMLPGTFRLWSSSQIEMAAAQVRKALGVRSGPLPNLTILLEHRGVVVARDFLADRELDGLSNWLNGRPFALVNNTKSPARSRTDLAHELGHLVLHTGVNPSVFDDKQAFKLLEKQAFRFAGALLLPRDEFAFEVVDGTMDELIAMKPRWQASIGQMIHRIEDLDLLSPAAHQYLWRKYRRSGWHLHEPLEDAVRLEMPTLLRSSSLVLRDEGGVPGTDIVEQAGVPSEDFLRLAGLDRDFTEERLPPNLIRLQDRQRFQS
jgi:Zn-dependent peptidase ImmA (M78 family)/transcriptional regulator with XRE-family HTH domain